MTRKTLLSLLLMAAASLPLPATAQSQADDKALVYIARDENPRTVISHLLGLLGRDLGKAYLPSRPVSGRFEVRSVNDVMAYFESAYQINWFEHGNTVHVFRASDWVTQRVYAGDYSAATDWQELLKSAGLYQKKFNVIYSEQHKELMVSGPSVYVKLVRQAFERDRPEEKPEVDSTPELMVFQLKHASVDDRVVQLRDQSFKTRGAYSVLLELLGMDANARSAGPLQNLEKLRNSRKSSDGKSGKPADEAESGIKPADKLSPAIDPNVSVTADARTNSILIRDLESKREYYQKLIDRLDVPVAMVEVEAMLVEIDANTLNELGVEFSFGGKAVEYSFPTPDLQAVPLPIPAAGASSIVDPRNFVARLRALESEKDARVLARPNIVTQDNVPAFIDLSETLYLRIEGERVAEVVPITAGSLLQVTPRLVYDDDQDKIFLRVEIQDGAVIERVSENPSVRNTVLSTQAVISRDKAILIGGYNRESHSETEHKVPVLGSLPVLGSFFTSTEKTSQNMVRLFLITPRIIEMPPHYAQSTVNAVSKVKETFKLSDQELAITPTLSLDRLNKQSSQADIPVAPAPSAREGLESLERPPVFEPSPFEPAPFESLGPQTLRTSPTLQRGQLTGG